MVLVMECLVRPAYRAGSAIYGPESNGDAKRHLRSNRGTRTGKPVPKYQIGGLDRGICDNCLTEGFAQTKTKILEFSELWGYVPGKFQDKFRQKE
jgi:hypothetical protein